jgi:aminoglycoside phosphotransferase (APT) family kinase protein
MRPPSRWTVTEPVAWFPERGLLLQAKAEGDMLLDLIRVHSPRAKEGVVAAGRWLEKLQSLNVPVSEAPGYRSVVERCRRELADSLPNHRMRIRAAADALAESLTGAGRLVPSHGDFHPMNVFLDNSGRLTAIDFDTFGGREPALDVAYFEAQLAIMGSLVLGSLDGTRDLRALFRESAPAVPQDRIDLHTRVTFLRTLHYDLCILKLKDASKVDRFLAVVEHGLGT